MKRKKRDWIKKAIEAELDGMLDFAATDIQKIVRGWRVRKLMRRNNKKKDE